MGIKISEVNGLSFLAMIRAIKTTIIPKPRSARYIHVSPFLFLRPAAAVWTPVFLVVSIGDKP